MKTKHHLQIYPWERWLKPGSRHTIRKGKHFNCSLKSMVVYVYTVAKSRGFKVHISKQDEETLKIQPYKANGKKRA